MENQNDFEAIGIKEWKLKVQAELAGLDYNEVLVYDTAEGIQVKPVYTEEDREADKSEVIQTQKDWKIIGRFLPQQNQDFSYLYGLGVAQAEDANRLPDYLDLFFEAGLPAETWKQIQAMQKKNLQYFGYDPIGQLAQTGNWYESQEVDFALAGELIQSPILTKALEINSSIYQNAGANMVQQLALTLAHGVEYLENLGAEAADKLYFRVAVGGNYFFEIAKLRALRKAWQLILDEYGSQAEIMILAETSRRNKSLLDLHNNLIRSTLEASSAIQGKADVVRVLPYDELSASEAFSEELASKQQLLLQKESFFDKFEDPISGTYFVENLTDLMIQNALDLFKKIESDGGLLQSLFDGKVQSMVQKSADKEQAAFDEGRLVLIGVNKFRNPADRVQVVEKEKSNHRTLIAPLFAKRLAEKLERE